MNMVYLFFSEIFSDLIMKLLAYRFCMQFLSHLLLARCDIGVQLSVRPSIICVESRKFTSSLGINLISLQQW